MSRVMSWIFRISIILWVTAMYVREVFGLFNDEIWFIIYTLIFFSSIASFIGWMWSESQF